MAEIERDHNPHGLDKKDEAPNSYISSDELLSKFSKYNIEIDETNIPRFASNNNIKMIKVKRIGSEGSTPTYYLTPSKDKIEEIVNGLKNNNNSFFGREMVKKKRKEILRIFNEAKDDKSTSFTKIAKVVAKNLGVVSNRKFVAKVLRKEKTQSQLEKKLIKTKWFNSWENE